MLVDFSAAADLPRPSLTYAVEEADHMRITNLPFVKADILELLDLPEQFDHIEAMGVLHPLGGLPWAGAYCAACSSR